MTDILKILTCPVCAADLSRVGGSLRCNAGHSFDIARAGYVNLLPPGKEKNAHTGDEREMVRAREEFLSHGHYGKITDTAAELIAAHVRAPHGAVFCDMGCGEGYHTCRLTGRLADITGEPVLSLGFDASKYAAERAAKLAVRTGLMPREGVGAPFVGDAAAYFMPANIFHLPVAGDSIDAAVSMFAPIAGAEAARILTKDGILVVVSSGAEHLIEMRRLIYDEVRISEEFPVPPDGFSDVGRHHLKYSITLDSTASLLSLFAMTPFYYKTTEAGRNRLLAHEMPFSLTVDVNYSIFKVV